MCETAVNQVHKFEAAGLGKAPFRFVGEKRQEIRYGQAVGRMKTESGAIIEFETKPGGTCAYCGQYIVSMFRIQSADGKEFVVGSDCVMKVGDAGLKSTVKKIVNAKAAEKRKARKAKKEAEDKAYCETAVKWEGLNSLPHPNESMAAAGKTLSDYADWMMSGRYFERLRFVLQSAIEKSVAGK